MTLSRLYTRRIYGVREEGPYGLLDNFRFREYETLKWPRTNIRNPFGVWNQTHTPGAHSAIVTATQTTGSMASRWIAQTLS